MVKAALIKRQADTIKTPQALIHIKHKISLLQYKYWILMIRELRKQIDAGMPPDSKGFRTIQMSVIAEAIGYVPNKSELWNDLNSLKNETIAYNVLEKDGGTIKKGAGFLLEWGVTNSRVDFRLPSFIEDLVIGLDEPKAIFQSLNWQIFNLFSGKYQAIIYKLCRDYRGVGRTPYMDILEFREYMGIEPEEYKEFRDLNRMVITGPINDINKYDVSDITVGVEFEKKGRKVIGLRFVVASKAQALLQFAELEDFPAFRFAKVPIDASTQAKYLALRSADEVQKCIERANEYGEQQEKAGKDPNYGALYRNAIKEGWHTTLVAKGEKKRQNEIKQQAHQKVLKQQAQAEEARSEAFANRIDEAFKRFALLSEDQKDQIRENFRNTLKVVPLRKSFDRQGEQAPMIRSQFAEYLLSLPE